MVNAKHAGLAIIVAAAFVSSANAGNPPVADPGKYGFSEAGFAKLRESFNKSIAEGEIAGMVGLVARDGHVVLLEALGMKDRENGEPMKADSIFWIASLTKIVTSAAAAMLIEEGKLGLDEPVSRYLPGFRDLKVLEKDGEGWKEVAPRRPMTIRHLCTHTAGLTYGWTKDRVDQLLHEKEVLKDNKTVGEMVSKLNRIPLKYHPGEVWEYSHATDVLGRVVEIAGGKTLDEFFRERFFKPLGMKDTGFNATDDNIARFAAGYKLENGKAVRSWGGEKRSRTEKTTYFSGGGGLYSTATDYYAFMQMLLNGGEYNGVRILKKETVEMMTTNQLPKGSTVSPNFPWVGNRGFGLGLTIYDAADGKGVIHSWSGATGTIAWINIPKKMIGVFMIHIGDGKFRERFEKLAQEAFVERP